MTYLAFTAAPYGTGEEKPMKSNYVIIGLLLFMVTVCVFAIVQDVARQSQYTPMCAKYGWVLAQSGPLNMPRCLDVDQGLFRVPKEMYYAYTGQRLPEKEKGQ